MKTRSSSIFFVFLFLLLSAFAFSQGAHHGIIVDGDFSPGGETSPMDSIFDDRLDRIEREMARIDPESQRQRVNTRQGLLDALANIQCRCGDEINLVMAGHGDNESFSFTKEGRTISARELKEALSHAAVECCCKINIVIFACHSGSFVDRLLEEEHVNSIYTSSAGNEVTHSNVFVRDPARVVDEGDWLKRFMEALPESGRGTGWADAIERAARESAEDVPVDYREGETPQSWRRGEQRFLAHVERNEGRGQTRQVEVQFYDPPSMRGKIMKLNLGEHAPENRLRACQWISGTALFSTPDEDAELRSGITIEDDPPRIPIRAHVDDRDEVHILDPAWQYCHTVDLEEDLPRNPPYVRCTWLEAQADVIDPDETMRLVNPRQVDLRVRVRAHVEGKSGHSIRISLRSLLDREIDGQTRQVRHWLERFGYPRTFEVEIPPDQRQILERLRICDNIWFELTIPHDRAARPTATDIWRIHRSISQQGWSTDAAVNDAVVPEKTWAQTVVPSVDITNVGQNPVDGKVWARIVPAGQENLLNQPWDARTPAGCWSDVISLTDLQPGTTEEVSFGHFRFLPGQWYTAYYRVEAEGDQVKRNDTASVRFQYAPERHFICDSRLKVKVEGTGRTTGHVITLTVFNPTDEAQRLKVGPAITRVVGEYQDYIIIDLVDVELAPGENLVIPLDGFCIHIRRPPLPNGEPGPDITTWITPDNMAPLLLPGETPPPGSGFEPVEEEEMGNVIITYPGTDIPFPYTIDIAEHPEEAAPFLFVSTPEIIEAYHELVFEDSVATPFSTIDPIQESEAVPQQIEWVYSSALEGEPYTQEDFRGNIIEQFEANSPTSFDDAPDAVKDQIEDGTLQFWGTYTAVGEKAKILVKKE